MIVAERVAPTAVHFSGCDVPKSKWPHPGMMLPVVVDLADPRHYRIEWEKVPTGQQAAENLAARLRTQKQDEQRIDETDHPDFPRVWREAPDGETSPELLNGLTAQQTELALAGAGAAVGLEPTIARVLTADEVRPSSAPGGTWDITVRVTHPNGGADWDAVTRMSFSSSERRLKRTAAGTTLPVLVDPDNHRRIIVDISSLS
ncbi:hypothetical protein G6M50_19925 [Agrobacterium rhizogenes]|nr:hypothetical protein [Rhizobium rhizogenes]NTJ80056.1 hypothetical protein [Rhizobium rhizogenes]